MSTDETSGLGQGPADEPGAGTPTGGTGYPPPPGSSGPQDAPHQDRPPAGGPPPGTPPGGVAPPPPGGATPPPGGAQPPPAGGYAPPPAGGHAPPQGGWYPQVGVVPQRLEKPFYSPGIVILLWIVTCSIWGAIWTYRTNEDLKKYNGEGLGGPVGVVVYLLLSPVLMFTIPNEIEKMYQRDGRQSPVSTLWGLWFLLPIIGHFVWYLKVQDALNDFWIGKGAQPE